MKSAVTISLVEEARGGPFVLWDGIEAGCRTAAELGFDAVEIFPPGPEAVAEDLVRPHLEAHGLSLAAVGTGAGKVKHGLTLVDADADRRGRAVDFVKRIIDAGAAFGAPAIIGSMQGFNDHPHAHAHLVASLRECGAHAASRGVKLIYEPLNRYETSHCTTMAAGVELLEEVGGGDVVLLADLFHMNIEESDVAAAVRAAGSRIGHVHFVDSNRRPAGSGHTDFPPIVAALRDVGYAGYLSAEAFPHPGEREAAEATIQAFRGLL